MSNAYPAILTLGALAGLIWLGLTGGAPRRRASAPGPAQETASLDAGLAALGAGLIGARLGYVVSHASYFLEQPIEALQFWQGGLSWAGGALGAGLGLALFAALTRKPFWSLADDLALPAALLAAAAWTGCLLDGCAYGRRASYGLLTPIGPDILGTMAPRWPTQAAGAVYSLLTIPALAALARPRRTPGVLACAGLALTSAGALAVSFFRGDPIGQMAGLRLDALSSAGLLVLALVGLVWRAGRA